MKHENLTWIDALRVLATFSVILLHVAAPILYEYGSVPDFNWWTGNVYDSMVRFCVPIFLMISGALILSRSYESIGVYLKKRVLRIVLPFLFWSIIYLSGDLIFQVFRDYDMTVKEFIFFRLKEGASYHLWYLYLLIGLYLFFPVIGTWLNNSKPSEINYFLGLWLLTVVAQLPVIKDYFPSIELSYFSGYIGFPILGYYLNKTSFSFNNKKTIYVLSILTGILITLFGTYFVTKSKGIFYEYFYSYLSPNVILVAAGIFLLFKDFVRLNSKIILFFSRYSYGVYLIHVLVLAILKASGLSYDFIQPAIGIPIISVLCFIISTLIIYGINKLPLGKYISG